MKIILNHKWMILLIIATSFALLPGVTSSFSSDDYVNLLYNTRLTYNEVINIFTTPYGREYRPLIRLSIWLNSLISQDAISFKIANLLFHLIVSTLVYLLLLRINFVKTAAIIGAAMFALHPIHTTSIHFILGRTDLILAIFYFSTLVSITYWQEKVSAKQYALTLTLFLGALLSKEMALSLIPTMFAVLLIKKNSADFKDFFNIGVKLCPFFIITAVYLCIRFSMWLNALDDLAVYADYSISNIIKNYCFWVFGLIYPADLYYAQDLMLYKPLHFIAMMLLIIIIMTVFLMYLLFPNNVKFFKSKWVWLGLFWLFVTLIPVSGGNPHRWYLYIPSFALSIFGSALYNNINIQKVKFYLIGILILLTFYAVESFRLSTIWKKQSDITVKFLQQIRELKIYDYEKIYFSNVPFGYKSAYLFTHDSLQKSIHHYFGKSPEITITNYLNIDSNTKVTVAYKDDIVFFEINPNHHSFFLLSADERRFEKTGYRDNGTYINKLSDTGKIVSLGIAEPKDNSIFLYYDGENILQFKK